MDKLIFSLLFGLLATLVGCGGGGGSDGVGPPTPDSEMETPSPVLPGLSHLPAEVTALASLQNFRPKESRPDYDIPAEAYPPIELPHIYPRILATLHTLEAAYAGGRDHFVYLPPKLLEVSQGSLARFAFSATECQTGTVERTEFEHLTDDYLILTYTDCQTPQGLVIHGQIITVTDYDFHERLTGVQVTYRDLNLKQGERHVIYSGRVKINSVEITANDLSVVDLRLDDIYHAHYIRIQPGKAYGTIGSPGEGRFGFYTRADDAAFTLENGQLHTVLDIAYLSDSNEYDINYRIQSAQDTVQGHTRVPEHTVFFRNTMGNTPPSVQFSGASQIEKGLFVDVIASAVDAEKDLLLYEWTLREHPDGCPPNYFSPQETITLRISPLCQGIHTLGLTVRDAYSTTTTEYDLVSLPYFPALAHHQLSGGRAGEGVQAQLQPLNPETEGPFTYGLTYAPSGMTIDDQGRITGTPTKRFPGGGIIGLGVETTNLRSTHTDVALHLSSQESSITAISNITDPAVWPRTWGDLNRNGAPDTLYRWGNTFAVLELTETGVRYSHLETREFSQTGLLDLALADIDNDGEPEVTLIYEDRYIALSTDDYQVKRDLAFPGTDVNGMLIDEAYLFPGPNPSITLEKRGGGQTGWFNYQLHDGSQYPVSDPHIPINFQRYRIGTSGQTAIVVPYSMRHSGPALRFSDGSEQPLPQGHYRVADLDGDGQSDLLEIELQSPESGEIGEFGLKQYDGETGEFVAEFRVVLHEALVGAPNYTLIPAFLQLDDQDGAELAFRTEGLDGEVHIYTRRADNTYQHARSVPLPGEHYSSIPLLQLSDASGAVIVNNVTGAMLEFSLHGETRLHASAFIEERPDSSTDNRTITTVQQDVTGDGEPEWILWQIDIFSGFHAEIYDQEMNLISTLNLPDEDELSIPDLTGVRSNHILGTSRAVKFSKYPGMRLVLIDWKKGVMLEKSEYLPGDLIPDRVKCLGESLETCAIQVNTNHGQFTIPQN